MWISTLFCFQNECRQSCSILPLKFGKYLDKDHLLLPVWPWMVRNILCLCHILWADFLWVWNTRASVNRHDAILLQFMTIVSWGPAYSYEIFSSIFVDSFFYSLNFGYFRFFLFILDLDTICIIYISILYCSFLGSIALTVPSAL